MTLIASPNLTVDRTVSLPRLEPGAVLRPRRAVVTAGSKGLNVGRVLAALREPARLVGFVPTDDAALVRRLFGAEPVEVLGVDVDGDLRVATIYLEDDGRVTVLNEPGPDVAADDWRRFQEAVEEELTSGGHATLVCSGSLPPGTPGDAYGRLTTIARRAGVRSVVDAATDVLAEALAHAPDYVTPNLAEAEGALGLGQGEPVHEEGPDVAERAASAVRALCAAGARHAIVTAGAAGAAFGDTDAVRWIRGVHVRVRNPIGAGDSFVGGFVGALESGEEPLPAVLRGLATATASCEHDLAGGFEPRRVAEIEAVLAADAAGRTWSCR